MILTYDGHGLMDHGHDHVYIKRLYQAATNCIMAHIGLAYSMWYEYASTDVE